MTIEAKIHEEKESAIDNVIREQIKAELVNGLLKSITPK
ncbi:MAG: hypothetical protein ACJAYB_002150 [Psychromonas sp.]